MGDEQEHALGQPVSQTRPWPLREAGRDPDHQRRFAELYESYGRHVLAWSLRRAQPATDAQDVMAETFMTCWRRVDEIPAGEAALPWLYTVAAGVLANHRRSSERRQRLLGQLQSEHTTATTPAVAATDVRADRLEDAMSRLRPSEAEVLRLAAWEGFGPSELAAALSCSSNAASIRLHRAKQALLREYTSITAGDRPESGRSATPQGGV